MNKKDEPALYWQALDPPKSVMPRPFSPFLQPKRIQRKRVKGWRMPENTVYVGRPSKWGNHYVIEKMTGATSVWWNLFSKQVGLDVVWNMESEARAKETAVAYYRNFIEEGVHGLDLSELRGKNLACWCREDAEWCHADVLLELANVETSHDFMGSEEPHGMDSIVSERGQTIE